MDATCFEGGGFEEHLNNVVGANISLKINWNAAANLYDSPPNFQPGVFLTTVTLYINVTDNVFWSFPQIMVVQAPVAVQIKQMISFSVEAVSDGTFSYPSGSV